MAKGYALLVGLKSVDPIKYGGWDGSNGCWGCELDVDNMERLLGHLGFQITAENGSGDLCKCAEDSSGFDRFAEIR